MNTETNLTYFLIGFINGARPWEATDEDEELKRMSGARSLGNALFSDLAQDDKAFNRALKAALQLDRDLIVQRLAECGVNVR